MLSALDFRSEVWFMCDFTDLLKALEIKNKF